MPSDKCHVPVLFLIRGLVVAAIALVKWHFREEPKVFHNPLEILGLLFLFVTMLCDVALKVFEEPGWPPSSYLIPDSYARATATGKENTPEPLITLVSSAGKSVKRGDS